MFPENGLDYGLLADYTTAFLGTPYVTACVVVSLVACLSAYIWRTLLRLGRLM